MTSYYLSVLVTAEHAHFRYGGWGYICNYDHGLSTGIVSQNNCAKDKQKLDPLMILRERSYLDAIFLYSLGETPTAFLNDLEK